MTADAFAPSDEEEQQEKRVHVLLRACDELMEEIRMRGGADRSWQLDVLEELRRTLVDDLEQASRPRAA